MSLSVTEGEIEIVAEMRWGITIELGTVLAVTHDRFFLENSAGWILEVADGKLFPHKVYNENTFGLQNFLHFSHAYHPNLLPLPPFFSQGNYTSWLEAKQLRQEMMERQDKQMQNFLARELEWIRKPAKARQAKSQARVKAYEKVMKEKEKRGRVFFIYIFFSAKK